MDATDWDDFALEYYTIQEESTIPIAKDLRNFLISEKLFPTGLFLDLAGGAGRYLSSMEPFANPYVLLDFSKEMLQFAKEKSQKKNTVFLKQDLITFLQEKVFPVDFLFSAMNPLLQEKEIFDYFINYPAKHHGILRVTQDEDTLFSPFENQDPLIFKEKEFWVEKGLPFKEKTFQYTESELISKDFFKAYFKDDFSVDKLNQITQRLFKEEYNLINMHTFSYTFLYG